MQPGERVRRVYDEAAAHCAKFGKISVLVRTREAPYAYEFECRANEPR